MTELSPDEIRSLLSLEPLGFEGGFYKESHRSERMLPEQRHLSTAIYYLLTPGTCSLMHRLKADELYHFYLGDPVELLMLSPDGAQQTIHLGPQLTRGQHVQLRVPAGCWQGSRLVAGGRFALMGTTMAPGFHFEDFELGDRSDLMRAYPEAAELLDVLTPLRLSTERLHLVAGTPDLLRAQLEDRTALSQGLAAGIPKAWPPPLFDQAAVQYALQKLESDEAQRRWWTWYFIQENTAVGAGGFKGPPDAEGVVEIGYSVLPEHQRQGIATEACEGLLRWAKDQPGVRRVCAHTLQSLPASIRVLEKLGFERVEASDETLRFERAL